MRLALAIAVLAACAPDNHGPGLDVAAIRAHVDALAEIGPRRGDSESAAAAAAYIESAVAPGDVELFAVGTVTLPEITVAGVTHRRARAVTTTDRDLIMRFGPPGKALLFTAHYDTVEHSPGAVDNAVAVGTLIELAKVLAKDPPARPVMLAFTANEEIGLVGAEALAERRGGEIDLAIALDLVGGSGDLIQNGASELIGRVEMAWLASAADRAGITVRAPLAHRVVSRWWPQAERADHGAFTRRGIRAFHLYNRGQDGDWIDLAYHSDRDVPSRVDPASVDELGRLLRALIAEPLGPHDGDGWWLPAAHNTVVPRWLLLALDLLLAAAAIVLLVRARRPRAAGRLGAIAGILCFVAAVGVTFAIERAIGTLRDHPALWVHAPLRWLVGELLVLGGVLGLATRLLARWSPWTGERRYLAIASIAPLVIGCALVAGGAAELAWIWLVPACAMAIAPRRLGLLSVLTLLLPIVLVLGPHQIREAAWNGFMPRQLPFVLWIAALGFPLFAGIAWYLRARTRSGPLGTLVLAVGAALIIVVGTAVLGVPESLCSAAKFHEFYIACEAQM